jgi:hypothetical protein
MRHNYYIKFDDACTESIKYEIEAADPLVQIIIIPDTPNHAVIITSLPLECIKGIPHILSVLSSNQERNKCSPTRLVI